MSPGGPGGSPARSGSPSSPSSFRGRRLERRTDDAANSLRTTLTIAKKVISHEVIAREGSPVLDALEQADHLANEEVREEIEIQSDRLIESCQELCKSELNTHWKVIRLKKAVSFMPQLLQENKLLKEEIKRARMEAPEELKDTLESIEAARRKLIEDKAKRGEEESAAKDELKMALETLKNGGFPDGDLVQFVAAALDSAIGVVFRSEDERSRTADELDKAIEARQDSTSSHEVTKTKLYRLEKTSREQTTKISELEDKITSLESEISMANELFDQQQATLKQKVSEANNLTAELSTAATDFQHAERQIKKLKETIENDSQEHVDYTESLRQKFKNQLQVLEDDNTQANELLQDRLESERKAIAALDQQLQQSTKSYSELEGKYSEQEALIVRYKTKLKEVTQENANNESLVTRLRDVAKKFKEDLQTATAEKSELQELLNTSTEAAEHHKTISSKLQSEKVRLTDAICDLETEAEQTKTNLREVSEQFDNVVSDKEEQDQQIESILTQKQEIETELLDLQQKNNNLQESMQSTTTELETSKQETDSQLEIVMSQLNSTTEENTNLTTELDELRNRVSEQQESIERLSGAGEQLEQAVNFMNEAQLKSQEALHGIEENKAKADLMSQKCQEFETRVQMEADRKIAEKQEDVDRWKNDLDNEKARNDRSEERFQKCVEQLKIAAEREHDIHKEMQSMDNARQQMAQRVHEYQEDGRFAKRNAQNVGWIIAGRGALIRDLHKLHSTIIMKPTRDNPLVKVISVAKELSSRVLATHLFECERRHLGMAPSEPIPMEIPDSPRQPSPRQSWRLFHHSPGASVEVCVVSCFVLVCCF